MMNIFVFKIIICAFILNMGIPNDANSQGKCTGRYDPDFFKTNSRFPVDSFTNKGERTIYPLQDGRYSYKIYSGYRSEGEIVREYLECLVDDKNNLEYFKRYDSLGRIISTSVRTTYGADAIGVSTAYYYISASDTIPKIMESIDFDRLYPICWRQALDIAKKHRMKLDDETKLSEPYTGDGDNIKKEWVVWRLNFHIAIDAYTGKVRKWKSDKIVPCGLGITPE